MRVGMRFVIRVLCVVWLASKLREASAREATRPPYCIGWEDPESREFRSSLVYERAEPDECKLRACKTSSTLVRSLMCEYVYASGDNPITEKHTAIIYNKPLKQGSTSIHAELREVIAKLHGESRLGDDLEKQVLQVNSKSSEDEVVNLSRFIKYWGWHIQLGEAKVEQFVRLRKKGGDQKQAEKILLFTSMRNPYSQVVSLFFEVNHNRLKSEPSFFTVDNLVRFIADEGRNNNFAYHFNIPRDRTQVDCAAIELNATTKRARDPVLRDSYLQRIEKHVERYDWVFQSFRLHHDFAAFNRIFELCPGMNVHTKAQRERGSSYKTLITLADIRSAAVKRAVYSSLCLDHLLYDALARRRAFLLRVYSGRHVWPECSPQLD